jgi:hypothetical protein
VSKRGNEKYIPGIYNYCDRWCERCPFTGRCRTFAMEQAMLRREARRDAENAAFWVAMEKAAGDALEELEHLAAELEPKAPDPFADAPDGTRDDDDRDEKEPLVVEAMRYGNAAHRWLERRRDEFVEGREKLDAILHDASEVILWYHMFIGVKLNRAFFGRRMDAEDDAGEGWQGEEPTPSDADGSAKIAIIGIDRSITAWAILMDRRPREAKTIRPIIRRLLRLRGWADREFPAARKFVRPGFDDGTAS